MGCNVKWAQGLQQDLAQRRASLLQQLAEAQGLQGKEVILADITAEEMVHQTQVSVLTQLHLKQAVELTAQFQEIKHLYPLLERQQSILEKVQEKQSIVPEMPHPQHPTSCFEKFHKEAFDILPSTINAR